MNPSVEPSFSFRCAIQLAHGADESTTAEPDVGAGGRTPGGSGLMRIASHALTTIGADSSSLNAVAVAGSPTI